MVLIWVRRFGLSVSGASNSITVSSIAPKCNPLVSARLLAVNFMASLPSDAGLSVNASPVR
ncbi:hypothetical protein D3C79_1011520 [compost metagenome]